MTCTPNLSGEETDPPGAVRLTGAIGPGGDGSDDGLAMCTSAQLFGLTVRRPAVGICVVACQRHSKTDPLSASEN